MESTLLHGLVTRLGMVHLISGSVQTTPLKSEARFLLPGSYLPGWLNKVEVKQHKPWSIFAWGTVLSLFRSGSGERALHFQRVEGNLFAAFRKERQHFLSQNYLSLLDKTPCYIYPSKIADDTLYSPALWHMVLSITLVNNRAGPPEEWKPQPARVSDRERWKKMQKSQGRAEWPCGD